MREGPIDRRRRFAPRRRPPGAGLRGAGLRSGALLAGLLPVAFLACGGDEAPSAERFCGEIDANKEALVSPTLEYAEDIEPVLDLYRDIARLAPIGISEEWGHLVSAYETASTVVPGDTESEQEALTAIYASERSAAAIDEWLRANCAVDIGPVLTIVPHGDPPVTSAPPTTPPG